MFGTLKSLQINGLSLDEAGIHPSMQKSFDQSIITCKAKDTEKLSQIAALITDGPVLSLQNGLGI